MSDDYDKIREAQVRATAESLGGALGGMTAPAPAGPPPQQVDSDLEATVGAAVTKALADMMGGVGGPQSFEEALADVDPADSVAALAMLDFLLKTGRLQRIGVLDGGNGYLFGYVEPKGSTKAGYRPGGTQGDRIVDEALDKQRNEGAVRPTKQGMCPKCMSVVIEVPSQPGVIVDEGGGNACPAGTTHELV